MPLYEHVTKTDSGEERITQRVRPAEDSKNAAQLAVKAEDDTSGWRVVNETEPAAQTPAQTPTETPAEPRRGRGTAAVPVTTGGEV